MKKKYFKILAFAIAIVLIAGLGYIANGLLGNPISKLLATNTAKKYVAETYAGTDYYVEDISYSFKDGNYHAFIKSPTSIDTEFSVYITMFGKARYDTYENVLRGFNTAQRLDREYRTLTDKIFEDSSFPYDCQISFSELEIHPEEAFGGSASQFEVPNYAMKLNELELDKVYDIKELGRQIGQLTIYVENDVVTLEAASEIMLEIKEIFDDANVPFKSMNFTLLYPATEDYTRPEGQIDVGNFLYEDIYEEGMVERVEEAEKLLNAYYGGLSK